MTLHFSQIFLTDARTFIVLVLPELPHSNPFLNLKAIFTRLHTLSRFDISIEGQEWGISDTKRRATAERILLRSRCVWASGSTEAKILGLKIYSDIEFFRALNHKERVRRELDLPEGCGYNSVAFFQKRGRERSSSDRQQESRPGTSRSAAPR